MAARAYTLEGRLERKIFGGETTQRRQRYVVLRLTDALQKKLIKPGRARVRIVGELQGHPVHLALQPERGANHYVMVGPKLLAATGALIGDSVTLVFDIADGREVIVPPELATALQGDAYLRATWESLTPGKRRTWCVYVDRPKGEAARRAKAQEVVDRVRRGLLGQRDVWP